jgi:hypothetical protein
MWRVHAWTRRFPELRVIAGHEPSNVDGLARWPEVIIGSRDALAGAN